MGGKNSTTLPLGGEAKGPLQGGSLRKKGKQNVGGEKREREAEKRKGKDGGGRGSLPGGKDKETMSSQAGVKP